MIKVGEKVFFKSKKKVESFAVYSPCRGEQRLLNQVSDEIFSSKMLGDGLAVYPLEGSVYAPCNAEILSIFPTKHALCLKSNDVQLMIHIGINTVDLSGKGFRTYVKAGNYVKKGELLVRFDREELLRNGYDITIMVLVIDEEKKFMIVTDNEWNQLTVQDILFEVKLKI